MEWRKIDNDIKLGNINTIEDSIGIKFPEDFTNFLLKHNHGRPKKPVFDTQLSSGRMMGSILNFNPEKKHADNFMNVYNTIKDKVPNGFFPFAGDPAGNYICAEVKNNKVVNVSFWNHELQFSIKDGERIETIENSNKMEFIAKDLDDFFRKLYIPE